MVKKLISKGPLANQLLKEMSQHKNSKIVDLSAWKEATSLQDEIEEASKKRDNESFDPLHRVYIEEQNRLSGFAELLSTLPFLAPLNAVVEKAEEEYMPSYPPMSPITTSAFAYWSLFDATVGNEHESYASLMIHLLRECKGLEPSSLELLESMYDSRFGLYRHEGQDNSFVYLKEFGTNNSLKAYSTSGYLGVAGEIWLARLLPPDPWGLTDYHVVVTTPYTIIDSPKDSFPRNPSDLFYDEKIWTDYIERNIGQLDVSNRYEIFMKYGPPNDLYYWLEYIFLAYVNHTDQKIILTGLPDQPHTLPHHPDAELKAGLPFNMNASQPSSAMLSGKINVLSSQVKNRAKKINMIGGNHQEKVGRNAPCPCGSEKKYKKCCHQNADNASSNNIVPMRYAKQDDEVGKILVTTTQEYIMPIRLQYTVKDCQALVNTFNSLRCLEWKDNKIGEQFIINYCNETCKMELRIAADQVPEKVYPVVLTHGKIVNKKMMILDVRSYLRGRELVKFIDCYIDRSVAKITDVILWNKIHRYDFDICKKLFQHDYDDLFASNIIEVVDGEAYIENLEAYIKKHGKQCDGMQEKVALMNQFTQENSRFREFEKLSMQCYEEDGINWLKTALAMREIVAFKRFSGQKNYTMYQLAQEMEKSSNEGNWRK